MANEFEPKLAVLPERQRRLWPELSAVPSGFVLIGGTAIAVQLGHRVSLDFDFIESDEFDPDKLYAELPFLRGSTQVQKSPSTLSCVIDRGGPVQASFFGTPALRLIKQPRVARDNGLRVASLIDLAGMKCAVVQKRAEAKDYVDLDAIIHEGSVDLPAALAAGRELYGTAFNPGLTLKSLCYFEDGNLASVPAAAQARLVRAVRAVNLDQLPKLERRDG